MGTASSSRQTRNRAPVRRPRQRYKPIKVSKHRWTVRISAVFAVLCVIWVGWAALARRFAPRANTSRAHFDTIIVLGYRTDADGNPTPEELARVTEGVREYERGVAPRLIFTGGPARNGFVQADVMARVAAASGIPPSAIFVENKADDTIQNVCFSERIMRQHGWRSAEVVSTAYHLPRVGLILSDTGLDWRTHAAPPLEPGDSDAPFKSALEVIKTMRWLAYARWAERCEP